MRLQRPIYTDKPVASIRLRITTTDVPVSAAVHITDIQLQAGELVSGPTGHPGEMGTTALGSQYRNGVVKPGLEVIGVSNADRAAPVRMQVRNAKGSTRLGSYRFGDITGTATVDGSTHTASHGYGSAPLITERQDLHLRPYITNRLHLRLSWKDRE